MVHRQYDGDANGISRRNGPVVRTASGCQSGEKSISERVRLLQSDSSKETAFTEWYDHYIEFYHQRREATIGVEEVKLGMTKSGTANPQCRPRVSIDQKSWGSPKMPTTRNPFMPCSVSGAFYFAYCGKVEPLISESLRHPVQ